MTECYRTYHRADGIDRWVDRLAVELHVRHRHVWCAHGVLHTYLSCAETERLV
jgi:hypothetical protein